MSRLPLALAAALLLGGCRGGGSPTAPSAAAPTYALSGRIVDASARTPVTGASLTALDGPNTAKSTLTAADGRYTLGNLAGGTFTLRVKRDGYSDYTQQMTVTADTVIDMTLIPTRSLGAGWTGGQLYATINGQQVGARVTAATVSPTGSTVTGTFSTAEGTSGSFSGQVASGRFVGTLRVDVVFGFPVQRCRASGAVSGPATGDRIELTAPTLALENCYGTATNLTLTITP